MSSSRPCIVVARYNENLDWLKPLGKENYNFIVYNKGNDDIDRDFFDNVIQLENIGREGHTYLYHIIKHYRNLSDATMFIQGDIKDHTDSGYSPTDYIKMCLATCLQHPTGVSQNAHSIEYDKCLYWFSHLNCNAHLAINGIYTTTVAPFKDEWPLGKWLEYIFGCPQSCTKMRWHHGLIFAATRRALVDLSISNWELIFQTLTYNNNPVTAHYLERSMYYILTTQTHKNRTYIL